MELIPFNKFPVVGTEAKYINEAIGGSKLSGDGAFTKKCQKWFLDNLEAKSCLMTPSCTHALELAALLINIQEGDEVIMPSYTFVSTANAFVLRGAKIKFIDIRPDTMNMDEALVEAAITNRTKAIVPVHYAGVGCEMDTIKDIAKKHKLFVIEDAAQGMMASYKGKRLGAIGDIGAYSFHETKNYTSGGEGGLLIISNPEFTERAEILREKGTNRSQFFRGMVDKYSWVDIGSSYLSSDLQAAYLYGQVLEAEKVNEFRLAVWNRYLENLKDLAQKEKVVLPHIPKDITHNAHMFYLKTKNLQERTELIDFLKDNKIQAAFHYVPLHSSVAGKKYGEFVGQDRFTTSESEKLVRLPLWYGLKNEEIDYICSMIQKFYLR